MVFTEYDTLNSPVRLKSDVSLIKNNPLNSPNEYHPFRIFKRLSPEYSFKIPNEKPEEHVVLRYFIAIELHRESHYCYFICCPFSLAAYIGICFLHDCSRTLISVCLHVYHKFTHTYEFRYHSEAYTKHRKRGNWIHAGASVLAWPAFLEVSNVPPGPSSFATHLLPSSFDGPEQLYYADGILSLALSSALPKFSDDWWLLMSGPTLDPLCSADFAMWKYFS